MGEMGDIVIREAEERDAASLLELQCRVDEESEFMLLEPGERVVPPAELRQRLGAMHRAGNQGYLVAERHGHLVGFLLVLGGAFRRNRTTALIVVGVRAPFRGRGIGTELFRRAEAWARDRGIHRMELTVMSHNGAGQALYRKAGFVAEGLKRHSLRVGDVWIDEHCLAKLLA